MGVVETGPIVCDGDAGKVGIGGVMLFMRESSTGICTLAVL